MASMNKPTCNFFARGLCRNGSSCKFLHEQETSPRSNLNTAYPVPSPAEQLDPKTSITDTVDAGSSKAVQVCKYFNRGCCIRGDDCYFSHVSPTAPLQQTISETLNKTIPLPLRQRPETSSQAVPDSRATVPCRFFSSRGGCQNTSCPYFHATDEQNVNGVKSQEPTDMENEEGEHHDDFTRKLSGALVSFDETGHVLKASLSTDFSLTCITGIKQGTTPEEIADILRGFDYNIGVDCIRTLGQSVSSKPKALVKVEDPLFPHELSIRLKSQNSHLVAVSVPVDARKSYCRKVYVSWHKATRSVWLNYTNQSIANNAKTKFNDNVYKIFDRSVKCSDPKHSSSMFKGLRSSYNSVPWTITLGDVPGDTTVRNIHAAIRSPADRPRHIELGPVSYHASDPEVSIDVRSQLEEHGPLESFYLSPTSKGKRVNVAAIFREEADARSACSLNNSCLPILKEGKITVSLVQSAKIKISTAIYLASKSRIEKESQTWREKHLRFHVYPSTSQPFTTMKIESDDLKEMAQACRTLDEISSGVILKNGESTVWTASLSRNGSMYKHLKTIEKELGVVIYRNKSKRQLQFYGSTEKLQQATARIVKHIEEECSTTDDIDLNPEQFSRMIRGGFRIVQQALGQSIAVFNVVSKKLTISGTRQEYELAVAIVNGEVGTEIVAVPNDSSALEADCPICFCEAENPLQTSCKHVYCLGCFEDYCRSAASTSKDQFQVKCQGDEGLCPAIFTLRDLKEWLSSTVFEDVLKSSFEEYIQRHPENFHYCPTPDCGFIYRTAVDRNSKLPPYSCPNCFESICTSCHARHGEYTCGEYKDIASGGYEALQKLKQELNIKDCPKCTTPMEKTEGCNHMTCQGCKAHICWVCMAVFESSGPCYAHMNEKHGGIGLGLQAFEDW